MQNSEDQEYYTVEEFAKKLKVCTATIRRAIKEKKIIALRPGIGIKSRYRIPKIEVERLIIKEMYGEEYEQAN